MLPPAWAAGSPAGRFRPAPAQGRAGLFSGQRATLGADGAGSALGNQELGLLRSKMRATVPQGSHLGAEVGASVVLHRLLIPAKVSEAGPASWLPTCRH